MPAGLSLVLVAFVLSLLASAEPAFAATHIGTTTYVSNTTWTLVNSPYVLDGDVTVAAGATAGFCIHSIGVGSIPGHS
jgi:hypothetical protein